MLQAIGEQAFNAFYYAGGMQPAAVAKKGSKGTRTFVLGFPFESITEAKARRELMASMLHFLLFEP